MMSDLENLPSPSAKLQALLADCTRAVVFTGAGISTESGIPDFRSPGGLWTKNAPIEFQDFMASEEMRREAWKRKFAMEAEFNKRAGFTAEDDDLPEFFYTEELPPVNQTARFRGADVHETYERLGTVPERVVGYGR